MLKVTGAYQSSAPYYDDIYHFWDYETEALYCEQQIRLHNPSAESLLDVACGTGRHLEYFQEHYRVEGLDVSDELLGKARERCPAATFHQGDMCAFDLGRKFDVVTCLFSAIGYVKTLENLDRALGCMASHLNDGGLLLLVPWFSPASYWSNQLFANYVDNPDLKISWMYLSRREGTVSVFDIHFQVGTSTGVTQFVERHEMGLFTDDEYVAAVERNGLSLVDFTREPINRGLFVSRKMNSK